MSGVDEHPTYRWVAGRDSAADAARSFARGNLRRRRWAIVVMWLLAAILVGTSLEDGLAPLARALWGLAYAGVLVGCALSVGLLIGRHLTRRRFATRLGPGTELTSRFGPSSLELTGPLSRHDLSYAGLVTAERVDGWVHLRQVGSPVVLVWPGELFPEHELERLRSATAARRP